MLEACSPAPPLKELSALSWFRPLYLYELSLLYALDRASSLGGRRHEVAAERVSSSAEGNLYIELSYICDCEAESRGNSILLVSRD